jgi:hypothetical protein
MRRIASALDASPARIPVLVGGCGGGRTTVLHQLRERLGRSAAAYLDIEHTATTPERFFRAVTAVAPAGAGRVPAGTRAAFDLALAVLTGSDQRERPPATFLFDEFLELRTFESFPGLRRVLHDFVEGVAASASRFVLTSRYEARTLRLLRDRSARFEVIHVPPLTAEDTIDLLGPAAGRLAADTADAEYTAQAVRTLGDGRPVYVRALTDELLGMRERGGPGSNDVVSALSASLGPDGRINRQCRFSYELRLHRARGYGALKAILDILAEEEGLTLTEISQRLQRTPGSTKDYLSWLEDVDLVTARGKRYSYADPMLRVWVRLNCRPTAASDEDLAREVHQYAHPRLPQPPEPVLVMNGAPRASLPPVEEGRKDWGIIEID